MTSRMLPTMLLPVIILVSSFSACCFTVSNMTSTLTEKTQVAWVSPENLTQKGGSARTIDDNAFHFDEIVFGELESA